MRLHIKTPSREFDYDARESASGVVIGNRKYDDVCIEEDPGVSGPHVRLEQFMGKWSFSDQFSSAGTIHNGAKKNGAELAQGDVLQLGSTLVTITALIGVTPAASFAVPADPVAPPTATEFKMDASALEVEFKAEWPEELTKENAAVEAELRHEPAAEPLQDEASTPAVVENTLAAGSVFEQRVAALLLSRFQSESGIDARRDDAAMKRIHDAARKAVAELEHARTTEVNLPFLVADASGPRHLRIEVARKHLHERTPDEPVQLRMEKSPRNQESAAATPATPAKQKAVALVVTVAFLVVMAAVIIPVVIEESVVFPDAENVLAEHEAQAAVQKEIENTVREALKPLLASDSAMAPEDALDAVGELGGSIPRDASAAHREIYSALVKLKGRVYSNMQKHFNSVSREVSEFESAGNLRGADAAIDGIARHVAENAHRKEAADKAGVPAWITEAKGRVAIANRRLLADKLPDVDEALLRRDYATASAILFGLAENAVVASLDRLWLKTEADRWKAAAGRQAAGQGEPPLKTVPKPPVLPPIKTPNALLPNGGTQIARAASSLLRKAGEALKAGTLGEVTTTYMGHDAVASSVGRGSFVTVHVTRPFVKELKPTQTLEFEVEAIIQNLPADTQLGLMQAVPNPSVEELLGILHHCFLHGFMDKAGETALRIRQAAPDKTAALDEILAAKWSKPVPEGGFPERDGRIVPE